MTENSPAAPSPLKNPDWHYVDKPALDEFRAEDWAILNRQRGPYMAGEQARQALRMLTDSKDDATFGYRINNYLHCLQSATLAMRDGRNDETIVVALFHDLGFVTCPHTHGEFAAAFLGAYISEANRWMLQHHAIFQQAHVEGYPGLDRDARERWRGHPHFEWTAEFVAKYDQNAIRPDYDTAPIEVFVPMVQRLFARTPSPVPLTPGGIFSRPCVWSPQPATGRPNKS